jgi:long-chain acyl-CoA synthetase
MAFERPWHRHYPEGVPAELEFQRVTMPEFLSRSARRYPTVAALDFIGRRITYAELEVLVNRFARALQGLGVARGDVVAMVLPNIPQVVIADYATYRIGAITAMANPLYTEHELQRQLSDCRARVVVTLDLLWPRLEAVRDRIPVEEVIVCHINDFLPFPKRQLFPFVKRESYRKVPLGGTVHDFMKLLRGCTPAPVENAAGWEEVGALMYTGGTTGVSKGAMLTHANLSCNVQQLRTFLPSAKDGEERELAVFPFFHSAGYTGVQNMCVYAGWTDVLVPRPEPANIIELLAKARPTIVPGVPTIYTGLLAHPRFRELDLGFVKAFLAGAAPLPLEIIRQLEELAGAGIMNVYGLTEISPMGTATPEGGPDKPGTVGVPIPSTDLKLVDLVEGREEVPVGEPGEVCFKGPQVMKGYHDKPEETARVLRDGWLHTGDVGVMDVDGYLTIVDRTKDLIVASGYNVYPNEIDAALYDHPKILEACTVGVPDDYRGETAKSFVVLRPGEMLDAEDVKSWCRERMAAYKVPTRVEFRDELPKSAVGKILRRELRDG